MSAARRTSLQFTKYSGAGNDFLLVSAAREPGFTDGAAAARALCRRGVAVGADGLVLITTEGLDDGIHGGMQLWNADGSAAEFSGNAARCAARYLVDEGLAPAAVRLQTDVGVVDGSVDGRNVRVTVPGRGRVWPQRRLRVEGRDVVGTYVVIGVPFFVMLHDNPDDLPVRYLGRAIRHHPDLQPAGANVDFVRVDEEQALYFRVYERGVEDETLSSGTGSIAAALAAAAAAQTASPVACAAAGGTLMVRFRTVPVAAAPVPTPSAAVPGGSMSAPAEPEEPETPSEDAPAQAGPRIAEGEPLEYIDIEVEGDTRRVMEGTAGADALRIR